MEQHFHCDICGKSYSINELAEDCFFSHSEEEILRYVAFTIIVSKSGKMTHKKRPNKVDWSVWQRIEKMNELFDFADVEPGGWCWNKAIRGQRL